MSSEENKSKSEIAGQHKLVDQSIKPTSNIFKEENPKKEKQIKFNQINNQRNETTLNQNDIRISEQNDGQNPSNKFTNKSNDLNSTLNENNKFSYFQSKKINLFEKKENVDKPCCCCTKTKCIKKYCECFANNRYCKDCHCVDCMNKFIYLNNNNLKYISENEKIFCTCTKSNCCKKYCECYKSGKKCNDMCRCVNCLNNNPPTFKINNNDKNDNININNNGYNIDNNEKNSKVNIKINNNNLIDIENNKPNINLDEEKSNSRKSSLSDDSNDSYKIQRISVFISQYQTLVNVEKFTKEDMKLISKKRYYNK